MKWYLENLYVFWIKNINLYNYSTGIFELIGQTTVDHTTRS